MWCSGTCLTLRVSLAVLGSDFQKYMEAFKPFLAIGLKNYAEYQVGLAADHHFLFHSRGGGVAALMSSLTQTSQC